MNEDPEPENVEIFTDPNLKTAKYFLKKIMSKKQLSEMNK